MESSAVGLLAGRAAAGMRVRVTDEANVPTWPPRCQGSRWQAPGWLGWDRGDRVAEYRTVWVSDRVSDTSSGQALPNATSTMNQHASEGWEVVSVVPGTNAQTYGGLFITFRR